MWNGICPKCKSSNTMSYYHSNSITTKYKCLKCNHTDLFAHYGYEHLNEPIESRFDILDIRG